MNNHEHWTKQTYESYMFQPLISFWFKSTSKYSLVQYFWSLQWGTKVLTHFRKMAPFCIVDILIPFPCLPQPLPPKISVEFWTLKSFFTSDNIDSGGRGIYGVLKEWNDKWMKCLLKAPVLNKCVNYFCPWLSEICICVFRLDFWRCWIFVRWRYSMGQIVCF